MRVRAVDLMCVLSYKSEDFCLCQKNIVTWCSNLFELYFFTYFFYKSPPFNKECVITHDCGVPKTFSIFGESGAHPSTYCQNVVLSHVQG